MKTKSTFFFALLYSLNVLGQTPITIMSKDMPPTIGIIDEVLLSRAIYKDQKPFINENWDYGNGVELAKSTNTRYEETDSLFINASVDLSKKQNWFLGDYNFTVSYKYDYNENGIFINGYEISRNAISIEKKTGYFKDSLIITNQRVIIDKPASIIKFPFSYGSSWDYSLKSTADLKLTAYILGLFNIPIRHVKTDYGSSEIIGYGKMRVSSKAGNSKYYDVLMSKSNHKIVDSIFQNNQVASPTILNILKAKQGQHGPTSYFYEFYRAGYDYPLCSLGFDNDSTYTKAIFVVINTTGVDFSNSTEENYQMGSIVFPMPASSKVNVMFENNSINYDYFEIFDLTGKSILSGDTNQTTQLITIDINSLPNGQYLIKFLNTKNNTSQVERISIQH